MKRVWEVGRGSYDLYETLALADSQEQARAIADAINAVDAIGLETSARVSVYAVPLYEAGDPLPHKVTVWSAWVSPKGAETESQQVWSFEVNPESARWGADAGRAHHQPTEEAALTEARRQAAR